MANELSASYATGSNLYALILNASGQAFNVSSQVFEAIQSANWASYAIAFTEQSGTGIYLASVPVAVSAAGRYAVKVYLRGGGTPAVGDSYLGGGSLDWTGKAEVSLGPVVAETVPGSVADIAPAAGGFKGNSALNSTADGFYIGCVLGFTGGALQGIARKITGYTAATRLFAFTTAFPVAPANNDPFLIQGRIDG